MNTPRLLVWRTFMTELRALDRDTAAQAKKALSLLAMNVNHPSLDTKRRIQYGQRKILASRINRRYRVLWERMDADRIAVWHIVHHTEADTGKWIPALGEPEWKQWNT